MNALVEMIAGYLHHSALPAAFFDAWVQSLAVLAMAGGLCFGCRRAAAATRHWIWFLALASLLCLPMLSAVPRAWHQALVSVSTGFESGNQFSLALNLAPVGGAASRGKQVSPAAPSIATVSQNTSNSKGPIAAHFSTTLLVLAVVIWLIGSALGLVSALAAQIQLSRFARNALPLQTPDWAVLLRETCETLRLRRPVRLLQSMDNPMPLTWGWWRPVVLLPADAEHWPAERRRVVLLHELAHVKRWDCLTQTVARIVCALYWINPLAWLAAHRMCVERELACDDLVLTSGCRASDYATHLVDIARAFRRAPRLAGIAMARSPKLQGRIAAIVDASRARRLRPFTALAIVALMGALALSVGGRSPDAAQTPPEDSPLRQQQIARLRSFAQVKARQSRELAAKAGEQISSDFQSFFDAATKGDWQTVTNRYAYYKQHHPQYTKGTNGMEVQLRTAYWQPVLELCLAYDQVVNCEPKYTAILAEGISNSVPAGSIYFGGTDPGRGVPTAFSKSHPDGDPFSTLTQNALADGTYLEYLRAMYGEKIYTPTGEDSQTCFQEYMQGAMRRLQENKLKPGENVKTLEVDGHPRVQVSGQVAVMSINGLLTKVIFDRNSDREFYVEESFPLDWMYPYLEPHGLIMKLKRQPLIQLPADVVVRDHDYWRKLVAGMLGDWLDDKTTMREVTEFVDRVYVRHDLKGFSGDPRFIQNDYARRIFSKLRNSIAGVYAWRCSTNALPGYSPNSSWGALFEEANLAFRQAIALCPSNSEALSAYLNWSLQFAVPDDAMLDAVPMLRDLPIITRLRQQWCNRIDDSMLLTETVLKLDPQNAKALELLQTLRSYKYQQGRMGPSPNTPPSLAMQVPDRTLTAAQAEALAEQLANEKAQVLYNCQPFRQGTPAQFVQGRWVWHDLRAQGSLDVEATVKFAADGTNPYVKVVLLDSRSSLEF